MPLPSWLKPVKSINLVYMSYVLKYYIMRAWTAGKHFTFGIVFLCIEVLLVMKWWSCFLHSL